MAFARDVYTATGGQTDFTISFPYQEQEDVRVFQNGALVDTADYTFPNATTVRLDTGATASDTIVLQRYTSQDTRTVDFTAGPLTESDLDNSAIQSFYMAQEALDSVGLNLTKDAGERWDAEGERIVNVGSPVDGTDAVTKDYADALATGTLGSPISIANGGTAATTAAAALTNLGAVPVGTNPATGVSYDNSTSGLTATDAQAAIDEIVDEFVPNTNATSYGFYTTRNAVDTVNDVDISAGQCWDTTRTVFMQGSAMTKRLDDTWAAGTGNGMLDTGTVAFDEGYHIYVMINDNDGTVDYLASLEGTWSAVSSKPPNYTKGQIIGYITRGSSEIIPVEWSGSYAEYDAAVNGGYKTIFSDSTIADRTYVNYDIFAAPADSVTSLTFRVIDASTANASARIYARYAGDAGGGGTTVNEILAFHQIGGGGTFQETSGSALVRTNSNREVQVAALDASGSAILHGYCRSFWLKDRLEATS